MKSPPSLLPEPRSYAGTAILLVALTALPFALVWSWLFATMQGKSFGEILPFGLGAGLFFGLAFGLTMAAFLKGETAKVKVRDRKKFVARLDRAMSELGYYPTTEEEDLLTYKPSLRAGLAAGRIAVELVEGQAVVVGPKMYVKKLVKRLKAG